MLKFVKIKKKNSNLLGYYYPELTMDYQGEPLRHRHAIRDRLSGTQF